MSKDISLNVVEGRESISKHAHALFKQDLSLSNTINERIRLIPKDSNALEEVVSTELQPTRPRHRLWSMINFS